MGTPPHGLSEHRRRLAGATSSLNARTMILTIEKNLNAFELIRRGAEVRFSVALRTTIPSSHTALSRHAYFGAHLTVVHAMRRLGLFIPGVLPFFMRGLPMNNYSSLGNTFPVDIFGKSFYNERIPPKQQRSFLKSMWSAHPARCC